MLKWALRIVAVGGALLALAMGTAAWMHRTEPCRVGVLAYRFGQTTILQPKQNAVGESRSLRGGCVVAFIAWGATSTRV